MITFAALILGIVVAFTWGFLRKRAAVRKLGDDVAYFPKLESVWLGCLIFSLAGYAGERYVGNPLAQVIDSSELWSNAFPFLIMVTILLFFSLKMTRSSFFRSEGLRVSTWKFLVFPPLGALLVTVPAVEVLNRVTDFAPTQQMEGVVTRKISGPAAWLKVGGPCAVVVKSPLQDGEHWTLRVNSEICGQVREDITPLKMNLHDGRFGIAYIDTMEVTAP